MRRIAATAAALALLFAAGCGGDDDQGEPIPADEAERMLDVLTLIEGNVEDGVCGGAESKVRNDLRPIVARLPENVDPEVESGLEDGVERLLDLIEDQCGEDETDTVETETQPTETETTPTETETQPTETETTPTETETQPTETEPPPPDDEQPAPPAGDDGGAEAPSGNGEAGGGGAGGARRTR